MVAIAGSAFAETPDPAAADAAFKQGRELFKAGKYPEACEQFEHSLKLDPANGTLFNLSQCNERIGKLASAAAGYRELVAKDTNDQRKATAAERLKAITPRIPKLLVKVGDPPPGIVVEIDSKHGPKGIAANEATEVDFGDYTIVARARGYSEFMSHVKISQESKTTMIEATLKPGASNSESVGVVKSRKPDEPPPRSRRTLYGLGGMATGGAVLVGGIVVGALARSKWNEAQDVCAGTCMTQADVDRANDLGDQARSKATLSTVLVLGGAAIGGVGAYLYFTAPGATKISPTASDSGAGVSISGAF
ncbi:MAG TPA: tetratricopeptide repeat protein [Kofleriaceae bacterium]